MPISIHWVNCDELIFPKSFFQCSSLLGRVELVILEILPKNNSDLILYSHRLPKDKQDPQILFLSLCCLHLSCLQWLLCQPSAQEIHLQLLPRTREGTNLDLFLWEIPALPENQQQRDPPQTGPEDYRWMYELISSAIYLFILIYLRRRTIPQKYMTLSIYL